jgi:hypothetical protein
MQFLTKKLSCVWMFQTQTADLSLGQKLGGATWRNLAFSRLWLLLTLLPSSPPIWDQPQPWKSMQAPYEACMLPTSDRAPCQEPEPPHQFPLHYCPMRHHLQNTSLKVELSRILGWQELSSKPKNRAPSEPRPNVTV